VGHFRDKGYQVFTVAPKNYYQAIKYSAGMCVCLPETGTKHHIIMSAKKQMETLDSMKVSVVSLWREYGNQGPDSAGCRRAVHAQRHP
jgi:hypothetical protein